MIGIMFRTRDYAIMLAVIGFLVVAIVSTVKGTLPFSFGVPQGAAIFTAVEGEPTYTAVVAQSDEPTREERLAALRKKIAQNDDHLAVAETTPEVIPEVPELPEATEAEDIKENRCSSYHAYSGAWSPSGLVIEEAEGARLVYRPGAPSASAASSSVPAPVKREIVAQLPVRSVPLATQSCVGMDVIGIAKDGSLIRNDEIGMYKVFGSETLVGYALDGFPIYGRGTGKTDICGGVMVAGQYRYQLSDDRDVILNCYAGSPVSL